MPTAYIVNPARDDPDHLRLKAFGTSQVFAPTRGSAGEPADLLFYGFVMRSEIIEGRTYTTQSGQTRVLKEAEIVLVAQEGERAMAVLSMVSAARLGRCR